MKQGKICLPQLLISFFECKTKNVENNRRSSA
jgi:hypothetical protein